MVKALVVDVIIPNKDWNSVFEKVFGITRRTTIAEEAMRRLDGYCYMCPEGDYIYGGL